MDQFKMQPFTRLDGIAVSLRRDNVDTDQVIPARYLKVPRSEGLGDTLFRDLRFDQNGKARPVCSTADKSFSMSSADTIAATSPLFTALPAKMSPKEVATTQRMP